MLAFVFVLVAAVSFRMAWLVTRVAPERDDARALAVVCAADAVAELFAAHNAFEGVPLDTGGASVAAMHAVVVACAFVVFSRTFAGGAPLRRSSLYALVIAGAASLLPMSVGSERRVAFALPVLFGLLCGVTSIVILARRFRAATRGDRTSIALILFGSLLRMLVAWLVFFRREIDAVLPGAALALIVARRAVVPVVADILASMALARSQLFRGWSAASKLGLSLGFAVGAAALAVLGIESALRSASTPAALRVLLAVTAVVPVLVYVSWKRVESRVEEALLAPLDPSRAMRREAIEEVAKASTEPRDRDAFEALACAAIARVTSASATFVSTEPAARPPSLSAPVAAQLSATNERFVLRAEQPLGDPLRVAAERDAPWSALIPVKRGGVLRGAIAIGEADLDRGALETAATIADQLAMRLEHEALFAERMRIHSELLESRRLATLGTFAAAIAHDIRTPLTSVQLNVQLLKDKVTLEEDDMEHFDIALEELQRLDSTVGTILEYARPVQLVVVAVDVDELLRETLAAIAPVLDAQRVRVVREDPERPIVLRGDVQKLRRVLQNLLVNAVEASPEGSTVTVRAVERSEHVELSVHDEGPGVRDEELAKIFEPFYTTRAGGTGLGLATVDRLVRAHGGSVRVHNDPRRGAIFTISLPIAPIGCNEP
ncbi:MAG: hypothetical protein JNK05_05685 [Myxococcales bacterium]|nr:hypothetical protein [Myxococcales bacterium]